MLLRHLPSAQIFRVKSGCTQTYTAKSQSVHKDEDKHTSPDATCKLSDKVFLTKPAAPCYGHHV